jgi:outer membrane protein assembly factor BamB
MHLHLPTFHRSSDGSHFGRIGWLMGLIFMVSPMSAEQWPQWRGPSANGISGESKVPLRWSPKENIAWRLALPGPAGSTPVIWNERIFLTSVDSDGRLLLLCISKDGQELWKKQVDQGNANVRGDEGNSASNSPCTDGKYVWAMMASGTLACFTVDGEEVWKFHVGDRFGKLVIQFGMTSTPVLDQGKLYLQVIHGDGKAATQEATVACLDANTGATLWKHARITGASQENEHSYASPSIYRDGTHEYLLTHGGDFTIAHRLQDGSEVWRYCLNPQGAAYHPTLRFVSSPLAAEGLIIVPSAKGGPIVGIDPSAQGTLSERGPGVVWRIDRGTPDVPSPLYHQGLVYLCRENGVLVCVDAKSGQQLYEERTVSDRHRASPIYAAGHIYLTARKGTITVVKAGPKFEQVAVNDLAEPTTASPVISQGRIYVRTFAALYAIEER